MQVFTESGSSLLSLADQPQQQQALKDMLTIELLRTAQRELQQGQQHHLLKLTGSTACQALLNNSMVKDPWLCLAVLGQLSGNKLCVHVQQERAATGSGRKSSRCSGMFVHIDAGKHHRLAPKRTAAATSAAAAVAPVATQWGASSSTSGQQLRPDSLRRMSCMTLLLQQDRWQIKVVTSRPYSKMPRGGGRKQRVDVWSLGREYEEALDVIDLTGDSNYVRCVLCQQAGELVCCEGCHVSQCEGHFPNGVAPTGDWWCAACSKRRRNTLS